MLAAPVGVRRGFERATFAAGIFASMLGLVALLDWAGYVDALRRSGTRLSPMVPNAAVSVLMLGAALALLVGRPGKVALWAARSLAFLAAVVGLLSLAPYGEGFPYPGRIEPASALAILLLGASVTVYDFRHRRVHHVAEIMLVLVTVIALGTLFGLAFGMNVHYVLGHFPAMPVDNALALLALAVGTVLLRTDRGWFGLLAASGAAGVTLRRLIPVAVAAPFFIGWLAYLGVTDDWLSAATGLTLLVSAMCLLLLLAVGWTTREIYRIDRERVSLLQSEREARDEAEKASRAKSDFLAVMSHDLRTPLNGVISYAELLEVGTKGVLNEHQLHFVERIRIAGSHLRSMIEELLLFTRVKGGVIETEVRCVDAVELALEALTLVHHEADSSKIEICRQFPPGRVEIRTDPDKVRHVLVNLLGNALKFTREGRVGLRLRHDQKDVVYEIWDTGPGIPREHRERIFQEFTQLDTATRRKGAGLGLAISASFAEMVGGKVELDSWVGRGSVFRLVLPNGGGHANPHAVEHRAQPSQVVMKSGSTLAAIADGPSRTADRGEARGSSISPSSVTQC